jgi:GT2 family glycosyltransferase
MAENLYVVIPTSGRPELLRRALASLTECRKPCIYRAVFVVENGRISGSKKVVESFTDSLNARYFYSSASGRSGALNWGSRQVPDDSIILFTDDDVRFDPGVLTAYATAAQGKNEGEFYGGPFYPDYEAAPPEWLKKYLPLSAKGIGEDVRGNFTRVPGVGFNLAVFSNDFKKYGGYHPAFGTGSDSGAFGGESFLRRKLLSHGVKGVYVPEAAVWHYVPRKRCSQKWALGQSHARGARNAMMDYDPGTTPVFLGYPRKLWTEWVRWLLNSLRTRILPVSHETRFQGRFQLSYLSGYFQGYRYIRRHPALAEEIKDLRGEPRRRL